MRAKTLIVALSLLLAAPSVRADDEVKSQRHLIELGLYAGALFPSEFHELWSMDNPHMKLDDAAFDIGLRIGYLPLPFLGVEMEVGVMPAGIAESDESATIYTFRGHLLAQYPARLAPFLVIGGGLIGVSSGDDALGSDVDGAFHWGAGFKYYATDWLAARLDARQIVTGRRGPGGRSSHFEVLAGVSYVIGWEKPAPPPDSDGDGVPDDKDACPDQAADTADGCPDDSDGDGVTDDKDSCPKVAAKTDDGCPPPDSDGDGVPDDKDACKDRPAKTADGCPGDGDGDGVPDDKDACPKVAAKTDDGCPPKDSDSDGIPDDKDRCADKPETKNGYQDDDGCPDEVPRQIQRFTGTIKGITFANGKAVIRPASFRTLGKVVELLNKYASLKLLIRGHTDDRGKAETNQKLSLARAAAVKTHLTGKGLAADRLRVEGVGPGEPIATNKSRAGRAKNRRIEFKLD